MTHKKNEMKTYSVIIAATPLTSEIKSMGPAAGEAFRQQQNRDNLQSLAKKLEKTVLKTHGGTVTCNELGGRLTVTTTDAGLEALKETPEINRISEAVGLEKLRAAGVTDVPSGLSWTRPGLMR